MQAAILYQYQLGLSSPSKSDSEEESNTKDENYEDCILNAYPGDQDLISSRFNEDFEDIYSIISREFKLDGSSSLGFDAPINTVIYNEPPCSLDTLELINTKYSDEDCSTNKSNESTKADDEENKGLQIKDFLEEETQKLTQLNLESTKELDELNKSNNNSTTQTNSENKISNDLQDSSETPTDYKCSRCDTVYLKKYLLEAHVKIFHKSVWSRKTTFGNIGTNEQSVNQKGKNDLYCELCDKNFPNINTLGYHKAIFHRVATPKQCFFCFKIFDTKILLDKHILKTHSSWRPFSCDICGQSFALKKNMERHISEHTDMDKNKKKFDKIDKQNVKSKKTETEKKTRLSNEFIEQKQTTQTKSSSNKAPTSSNKTTTDTVLMESKEWRIEDDYKKLSRKRRKLETGSVYTYSMKYENPETLFEFECMKCQIHLISMSLVAAHSSQCPNNAKIDKESKGSCLQDTANNLELQKMQSHLTTNDKQDDNDASKVSAYDNSESHPNGHKGSSRMIINCGFCTFMSEDFLSYNDHLKEHGV